MTSHCLHCCRELEHPAGTALWGLPQAVATNKASSLPVSLRSIRTGPRCIRRSGRTALYWVHTPMNRSDVIDPETKSRGATPS